MRLLLLVEGPSEEAFVNGVLAGHLRTRALEPSVRLLTTRGGRGGVSSYARLRRDLERWLREEPGHDCRFTTMIDTQGLPKDFPGWDDSRGVRDPYARVRDLEAAFAADVQESRFLPYLQLHEFEALLLSDPDSLKAVYPGNPGAFRTLERACKEAGNPERINLDAPPSRRIRDVLPGYQKVVAASQVEG